MNKSFRHVAYMALASTIFTGCAFAPFEMQNDSVETSQNALVTSLGIKRVVVDKTRLEPAALDEIRNGYADLVGQFSDESLAQQLALRLADVEMLLAEEKQVALNSSTPETAYQDAISAYTRMKLQKKQYFINCRVLMSYRVITKKVLLFSIRCWRNTLSRYMHLRRGFDRAKRFTVRHNMQKRPVPMKRCFLTTRAIASTPWRPICKVGRTIS